MLDGILVACLAHHGSIFLTPSIMLPAAATVEQRSFVYLRAVTRYMHLNPVKIAACRRLNGRQRLERLNAYRWSSYAGSAAIGAIHRRPADRPDALETVESLTKQLSRKRIKYKA